MTFPRLTTFSRLFIANRAEIAQRITLTAQAMGLHVIVPYTWADADLPFVAMADTAVLLESEMGMGGSQGYLDAKALLKAALASGAEAIHPGYGFLSENPDFAQACLDAGFIFVGPSPQHIAMAGDKAQAKATMKKLGIPTLPGFVVHERKATTPKDIKSQLETVGFPCIVKPLAGGGGKGMHIVETLAQFNDILPRAQREALNTFGNDALMIERYCPKPRHIEVQIVGDKQGNAVHVFERNCSLQRRHQKIIEEARSPKLDDTVRQKLYDYSLQAVRGMGYINAGTMEFLVDASNNIYFLEMNTRLQVEHPVTEMITGIDLVEWQLLVADGAPLPLSQDAIHPKGHAIEVRLYAENTPGEAMENGSAGDTSTAFTPSIGCLEVFHAPPQSVHHRLDAGYAQGNYVSPYYDPMIAKVIVWGDTRKAAIENLETALRGYHVLGVATNLSLLQTILKSPYFQQGTYTTATLDHILSTLRHQSSAKLKPVPPLVLGRSLHYLLTQHHPAASLPPFWQSTRHNRDTRSGVVLPDGVWWLHDPLLATTHHLRVTEGSLWVDGDLIILQNEKVGDNQPTVFLPIANGVYWICPNGGGRPLLTRFVDRTFKTPHPGGSSQGEGVMAPLPGTLRSIMVHEEQAVAAQDPLLTLEAMKTEYVIKAPRAGVIGKINYRVGDFVQEGAVLLEWQDPSSEGLSTDPTTGK